VTAPHERLAAWLAEDMTQVDAIIRERMGSENAPRIPEVTAHLIGAGGKRLRPLLTLAAARLCGYEGVAHHALAAAVEFIHTATLLHDDVVDDSGLRRGRRTANALFGNAASVLVGDFLYSRAFQMMVQLDAMRVMQVLAEATNTIAEGEVLQLMNCHDPEVDEPRYLTVIRRKTAKLFEAAARLGGILGEVAPVLEQGLAEYGMRVGTAFQLTDDVLDYSGDAGQTGKSLGDDLAEGKPTLPLIHAMATGTAQQSALIRRAIVEGGRGDFRQVLAAIEATGALAYTRQVAQRESDAARRAIALLPPSVYRNCLLELASFSVARRH
jgi:octaprenyl-diphosphate synthase